MKKLFFIAAIASVALASCVKNEVAPTAMQQNEITFAAPVVGPQTKAVNGAIDADYDIDETFDVWCVHNSAEIEEWGGNVYFSDIKAAYNSTASGWVLETKYYWPATGKLSFVALSPSMANATSYDKTNGFKVTGWSQGASEAAIVDMMYSEETRNKEKADYNASGEDVNGDDNTIYKYNGVDINFKHALSYLVFKVKTTADYSPTMFRLNGITLSGVYTTGDFTQKPAGTDPNWAVDTDPAKVGAYVAYTDGELSFNSSSAVEVPETEKKQIILLPQTLTTGQQKIKVDYQISTDGKAADAVDKTWIDQTQTVDLKNATVSAWEMGKKYTYTLSIGMQEIIFDPAVTDWTSAEGGVITF